jgi:hypothetical protein
MDTGSDHHITNSSVGYKLINRVPKGAIVAGGTGNALIHSQGRVTIPVSTPRDPSTLILNDVFYAPQFSTNVIGVSKLIDKGYDLDFRQCRITSSDGEHLVDFHREGGMYVLIRTGNQGIDIYL